MLIWLASYPRSGNTFLRILLKRLYGFTTTTGYDDNDPVAQRIGPDFVGYQPRIHQLQELVDQSQIYFAKTHRQPHRIDCGDQPAIYLVRDGRDAIVSFAYLRAQQRLQQGRSGDLKMLMQELICEESSGTGNWGLNVLRWLKRSSPPAVIRFEQLICQPELEVSRALETLRVEPKKKVNAAPPIFPELHAVDKTFFRRGVVGSYQDEMSQDIQEKFWQQPHHAEAMALLGYT
jgi:hypothetical protein